MKRSDISGTDALAWMQVLNYSRPAGTAAEKQAAEQIAASIRPFADFVSVESFAWRPRKGDGNNEVLPSQNVCAFLAGTKDTPEYLVLSAHYDSVPEGPGAYDNLSSCAVMAELLRYFSCHRPKRSLPLSFSGQRNWDCSEAGRMWSGIRMS
jgi:acetylornithine deacetylase/succinyl-diaminopimelate desuccinylase-like protein